MVHYPRIYLGLALAAFMAAACSCPQQPTIEDEGTSVSSSDLRSSRTIVQETASVLDEGATIEQRFPCPAGTRRMAVDKDSFGHYLRKLPLRPTGSRVQYYDAREKHPKGVYAGVVDMELDPQDLQQCADAVMRLRGEYLFSAERMDEIHFDFVADGEPRYFVEYAKGDLSYTRFRSYMKYVFSYANTASLKDELDRREFDAMQIGDVFIQKGRPFGHAVIVVDMCENKETDQRYFMLAQSFIPAQDTQILLVPHSDTLGVWYEMENDEVVTPEWTFSTSDLHHF